MGGLIPPLFPNVRASDPRPIPPPPSVDVFRIESFPSSRDRFELFLLFSLWYVKSEGTNPDQAP